MEGVPGDFEDRFDGLYLSARRLGRRMLGDSAAAEDVAAEALARTFVHWRRVRDLPYLEAWVLRVAANVAIDASRPRRGAPPVAPDRAAEDAVVLRLALVDALRSLPRRQRESLALRYLCDVSEQEVARTLGISVGSVKRHVHRGVEALRGSLGPQLEGFADGQV